MSEEIANNTPEVDTESPPETKEEVKEAPEQEKEKQTEETTKAKDETKQETEQINEKLSKIGFDLKTLEEEYFNNNGVLTDETIKALEAAGFSKEFQDSFIEGRKAIYEKELDELSTVIGGRDNYNNLIEWSAKNIEADVINSINAVKDKNILKLILPTLQNKMINAEGKLPETVLQGTGKASVGDVFESREQMYAAVRDARYMKDEAYQEAVTRKIRASREAGIDLGI